MFLLKNENKRVKKTSFKCELGSALTFPRKLRRNRLACNNMQTEFGKRHFQWSIFLSLTFCLKNELTSVMVINLNCHSTTDTFQLGPCISGLRREERSETSRLALLKEAYLFRNFTAKLSEFPFGRIGMYFLSIFKSKCIWVQIQTVSRKFLAE